jgi:hypothetical protein
MLPVEYIPAFRKNRRHSINMEIVDGVNPIYVGLRDLLLSYKDSGHSVRILRIDRSEAVRASNRISPVSLTDFSASKFSSKYGDSVENVICYLTLLPLSR